MKRDGIFFPLFLLLLEKLRFEVEIKDKGDYSSKK